MKTLVYVILNQKFDECIMCRIFDLFTMETILAIAFGRHINMLRGESSNLTEKVDIILSGLIDGEVNGLIMLESKDTVR